MPPKLAKSDLYSSKYSKITELTNSHRAVIVKVVPIHIKWYLLLQKDLPHLEAGGREGTDPKNK